MEYFSNVNWMAVSVGTVVSFITGWVWYSPKVFGEVWAKGSGVTLESEMKPLVSAFVFQFSALLLLAIVIAITATIDALFTAILMVFCVVAFVASASSFIKKSMKAIMVEGSYIVVCGIIMIVSQAVL